MEADKLNFETVSEKLILCNPYHYDDPISKECIKSIKEILESQLSTKVRILNVFTC